MAKNDNSDDNIISNFFEDQLKPFVHFLIYLRVPLTIAVVSYLFFTQIDQTIEVYRVIAFDNNVPQAVFSTVFVILLSLGVWFSARSLEKYYRKNTIPSKEVCPKLHTPGFVFLYNNVPRWLGIIPLLGLACGTWTCQQTLQNLSVPTPKIFLLLWIVSNLVLSLVLIYLFIKRVEFFNKITPLNFLASTDSGTGLFGQTFENIFVNIACIAFSLLSLPIIVAAKDSPWALGLIAVFLLIVFFNVVLFSWQETQNSKKAIIGTCLISLLVSLPAALFMPPTFLPELLGSISLVAISFTILVVVFSTIYNWGLRTKIPGITILIVFLFASSAFNWNDNHRFRQFSNPEKLALPSLESSFQQWLANRPDLDQFSKKKKPYPVYIAAAQGGGIYAAYHAATAFTRLTEYFPSFPQHVFAISGVSGGSLGSSAFSSLVKVEGISSKTLSQKAGQLFSNDLLSPLLTMGLFPDLIQRFNIFPIYDWDRSTGLEVAFEKAWDKLSIPNQENPLHQSFYKHWQPQSIAPALVLNTTVVETGDRLVISPFKIPLPNKENIALDEPNLDLKLSTAAVLSARFPYFTPVGWYQRTSDNSKLRLADGGYFDNSGIPTALDIGRNLQKIKGYGTTFEIVYLSLIDGQFNESTTQIKSEGVNEVLSPIRALFSARESRSRSAVELSTFTINDGIDDPLNYKFRTLFLKKSGDAVKLPLGWLISDRSREFIDRQTPDPKGTPCDTENFRKGFSNGRGSMDDNHNRCVITSIGNDLSYTNFN